MERARALLVVLVMILVALAPGCLEDGEGPGDGNGDALPHEGTTAGFILPDFQFIDPEGTERHMDTWRGDLTILHVIAGREDIFIPQVAQIQAVRQRFDNISVRALTISTDPASSVDTIGDLRLSVNAGWTFAVSNDNLTERLSLVGPLTVFLLNKDHVILLRRDGPLGQGRMIKAIQATWGMDPPEDRAPEVGQGVPELVWRDIDGVDGTLSGLQGSPVILNVWEMECPFCIQLFGELVKVYANHSSEGLRIVSLDLITWETAEQVRSVMEEHNATWTFAVDGDNIQSRYDIWRLPLLVLLDGDGVVRWTWTGYVHHSVIDEQVENLI